MCTGRAVIDISMSVGRKGPESVRTRAGCPRSEKAVGQRRRGNPGRIPGKAKAKACLARTLPQICAALARMDKSQRRLAIESLSMTLRTALIKLREAEQQQRRHGILPHCAARYCPGGIMMQQTACAPQAITVEQGCSDCKATSRTSGEARVFGQNVRQVGPKAHPSYQVCLMVHRVEVRTTRLPTLEMALSAQRSLKDALQAVIAVPQDSDAANHEDLLAEARLEAIATAAMSANICVTFQATLERVTGDCPRRRRHRVYSACLPLADALQLRREALNAEAGGTNFVDSLWACWEQEGLRPARHCKRSLDGLPHPRLILHGSHGRELRQMDVQRARPLKRGRGAGAVPQTIARLIARAERAALQWAS
mmetsp:Transcript_6931/g.12308  ORF Transcript_6931/g.12308 Transcript_6931/m.12308 type:complete len:368 (+) Transcript_6931:262-1365(+)